MWSMWLLDWNCTCRWIIVTMPTFNWMFNLFEISVRQNVSHLGQLFSGVVWNVFFQHIIQLVREAINSEKKIFTKKLPSLKSICHPPTHIWDFFQNKNVLVLPFFNIVWCFIAIISCERFQPHRTVDVWPGCRFTRDCHGLTSATTGQMPPHLSVWWCRWLEVIGQVLGTVEQMREPAPCETPAPGFYEIFWV